MEDAWILSFEDAEKLLSVIFPLILRGAEVHFSLGSLC